MFHSLATSSGTGSGCGCKSPSTVITPAGLDDVVDEVPEQDHGSVVEEVEEHEDTAVGEVDNVGLVEEVYTPAEVGQEDPVELSAEAQESIPPGVDVKVVGEEDTAVSRPSRLPV